MSIVRHAQRPCGGSERNRTPHGTDTARFTAEVRDAVEMLFDVSVESVRIVNVKGKNKSFRMRPGKRSDWKKAYVRVQEGQVIDFLGGESV